MPHQVVVQQPPKMYLHSKGAWFGGSKFVQPEVGKTYEFRHKRTDARRYCKMIGSWPDKRSYDLAMEYLRRDEGLAFQFIATCIKFERVPGEYIFTLKIHTSSVYGGKWRKRKSFERLATMYMPTGKMLGMLPILREPAEALTAYEDRGLRHDIGKYFQITWAAPWNVSIFLEPTISESVEITDF